MLKTGIKTVLLSYFLLAAATTFADTTLLFSNMLWHVREGTGGPGPNHWSKDNAWVDNNGWLHLKISKINNVWYCPEIYTDQRLGFGEYRFKVLGYLDQLDPNIILGLFHYTTPDVGPDGTNEIDIEFSRWGDPSFPIGGYTVWPAVVGEKSTNQVFDFKMKDPISTHGYVWSSKYVLFKSGFGELPSYPRQITSWRFKPTNYLKLIPQQALPLHLNLWLLGGKAPTNQKEVELIIKKVCYFPEVGTGNCNCEA